MREQIFTQRLEGLYEKTNINPARHATIILKPGSCNNDAKTIVRAARDQFAEKRWDLIMNHLRATYDHYRPIKVDFPVKQILTIQARGHLTDNLTEETHSLFSRF